ncbi:decapping endonuclease targeting mRNA [Malassezia cuniculi]|uniref:Decapping nuclease n=1 Tax=Malassezia cuniculi TaxID=948313 RepID=A0AAF0EPV5_9BASI|nr:decapping endonuclease targeting mRNA [Malassezia cuniculi]
MPGYPVMQNYAMHMQQAQMYNAQMQAAQMYGGMTAPAPGMCEAQIPPLERPHAALAPVSVQQPVLLTTFSYDAQKNLLFDDSAKRWYHEPPTKASGHAADLNYGFEHYHDKPHIPDPLDSVLYTIMERASGAPSRASVNGVPIVPAETVDNEILRMHVVTWRGIMTKLCTAWSLQSDGPPQFREGFELNAMMVKYYGRSFESYCTRDSPDAHDADKPFSASCPPGWGGEVNQNVQWCHIVKTRLGNSRILLGGEVDCVEGDDDTEHVVELKTSMQPNGARDETNLRVKMLRMYMQSFLLGVRTLVIGFRDAHGMLLDHKRYRTTDLPRLVRGQPGQWNANDNLAYGAHIISYIRRAVAFETEQWLLYACNALRGREAREGAYPWRVHRSSGGGFLSHLPLPAASEAVYEYPVFRISLQPPFSHVSIRRVPRGELALDGRRANRCGIVPAAFYEWATEPIERVNMYI